MFDDLLRKFRTGKSLTEDTCQCGRFTLEPDTVSESPGDGFNHNREACRIDDHVKLGHFIVGEWEQERIVPALEALQSRIDAAIDAVREWKNKEREIAVARLKADIARLHKAIGLLIAEGERRLQEITAREQVIASLEQENAICKAQLAALEGNALAPVRCECGKIFVERHQAIVTRSSDGVEMMHRRDSCTLLSR